MSLPPCQLPVDALTLATALFFVGCVDSTSSNVPSATPAAQSSQPNPKLATRVESLESAAIVMDADLEIQQQLQKALRAVSYEKHKYAILFVQPDASKDYKILRVEPDPTRKYTIVFVDPKTNQPDSVAADYLGNVFPALKKDAGDPRPLPSENAAEPGNEREQ